MVIPKGHIITGCELSDVATVTTRHETEEGYLDVHADISRSGIYEYQAGELGISDRDPAQMVRILRTDDEVFSEQSMSSFAKKPVTDNHPPALVDSGNARFYNVGQSGEKVVRDGDNVSTTLLITDKKAVEKIKNGTVQLSCGYKADIIFGDGVDDKFGPFEAVQKNIRGNHIAIVERGRAGHDYKIKDKKQVNDNKGAKMLTVLIDGITIEVTEQGKQAIEILQSKLADSLKATSEAMALSDTAMETTLADHNDALSKLQGELDVTKEKVLSDEQIDAKVAERANLVDSASKIVKDFDATGKTNEDIKRAVITAKLPNMKLDDKDSAYVDVAYDTTMAKFSNGSDNLENLEVGDEGVLGDDAVAIARQRMTDAKANAWNKDKKTA